MNSKRTRQSPMRLVVAGMILLGTWSLLRQGWALVQRDFSRWEKSIAAFEQRDKVNPPPENAILFAGSSSIYFWDLKKAFPGLDTINRGFGGSQIADSTHFAARIILKHRPRTIVFYAGDNDIADGRTPEQVHEDFRAFVETVHEDLPKTRIVFIGIKPSPLRWKHAEKQQKANALVEGYCKTDERLRYIDTFKPMLGDNGMPRTELYRKDNLHLSEQGYQLWNSLLEPIIK
jgi:lysophospholipase L1-like esterase